MRAIVGALVLPPVVTAGSNGPGFDPSIFAASVEPSEELEDEHASLVEGLRRFSRGSRASRTTRPARI